MPPKKTSSSTAEPRRSTRTKTSPTKNSSSSSKSKSSTSTSNTTTPSKTKPRPKPKPEAESKSSKNTHGSKHDTHQPPAAHNATPNNLPHKGQSVTWKAMPGWVHGHVLDILTADKEVDGKSVKASKDDPRIVLKSHGPSGKVAVHKAAAVWFD